MWVGEGMSLPARKALARRGTFAAKQIFFQTSPLAPWGGGLKATARPGRCWSSPKVPTAAPLGFAGGLVARLCQAALRRERARREKERDRGRSRRRGYARGRRLGEAAPMHESEVAQSCLILCSSIDCRMKGLPVYHQLPEFTQTHPLSW